MMKKNIAFLLAAAMLAASALSLCGCSSCSREMMYASSTAAPPKQQASAAPPPVSEPEEEQVFEPESDIEMEPKQKEPLLMQADFDAIALLDSAQVQWGPGVHKDELGRSTACVELQQKYSGYNACFIDSADLNGITLTFDQGYENGYTAPILDALREKGVSAIFFLTGHYVRSCPELVQRMIDEGHILGSHSDSHKVYCRDISIEESFDDAKWMQDYLRDNFGYEMRLFRFPEGVFSEQSLELVKQMGYSSVFWSFAYNDWDPDNQPEPKAAMERITSFLHPGEIMLLHSVSSTNAEILPELIDVIRERGYDLTPFPVLRDLV